MALLLMGFGEAVVVLCRRYLVANRWIEVGANTAVRNSGCATVVGLRDWGRANWLEAFRRMDRLGSVPGLLLIWLGAGGT